MTGPVWWSVLGGGWIHGPVDTETGELTGDEIMWSTSSSGHSGGARWSELGKLQWQMLVSACKVRMIQVRSLIPLKPYISISELV